MLDNEMEETMRKDLDNIVKTTKKDKADNHKKRWVEMETKRMKNMEQKPKNNVMMMLDKDMEATMRNDIGKIVKTTEKDKADNYKKQVEEVEKEHMKKKTEMDRATEKEKTWISSIISLMRQHIH